MTPIATVSRQGGYRCGMWWMSLTMISTALLSLSSASAASWLVNLATVANRALLDHGSARFPRGWSKQGPDNSLRHLKAGRHTFDHIPFRIIHGKTNHGAAIIAFAAAQVPGRVTTVTVAAPQLPQSIKSPLNLYVLHTACFAGSADHGVIGTITVHYPHQKSVVFTVRNHRDVADWWHPVSQSNARVVYTENNGSARVGVYLSRFDLPAGPATPQSISLHTAKGPEWIVLAMTLSSQSINLSAGNGVHTIIANRKWKRVHFGRLLVRSGTALDMSFLIPKPAGKYGFVTINHLGQLVFADRPSQPLRFLCDSQGMATLPAELTPMNHRRMNEFAQQEARMGFNAIRSHMLDAFLMFGSREDGVFDPQQLKLWDYFSAALKRQGIYLFLDITSDMMFPKGVTAHNFWRPIAYKRHFDTRLYWDPYVRKIWKKGVTELLDHVNPYTGLALKNNPQVIVMQTRNESTLFKFLSFDKKRPHPGLLNLFRQWLQTRYGNTAALRLAWTQKWSDGVDRCDLPEGQTLKTVQFPKNMYTGPAARDFQRFCIDTDKKLFLWMHGILQHLGAKVPATDFNYVPSYGMDITRDVLPLVDMHCYHELPSHYLLPGSQQLGYSALNAKNPLGYLCTLAGCRQWGKPFTVSETGEPFWNRWRFEAGFCWPSMAALQGWNMVCNFGEVVMFPPAQPKDMIIRPFQNAFDPANRAGQYIAALLYLRGDLRRSPHLIDVRLNARAILRHADSFAGIPAHIARLALLSGFGCHVADDSQAAPCAPFTPNLVIPINRGARVVADRQGANIKAAGAGGDKLARFVHTLQVKGILSPHNRTNVAAGRYQSDTGQIYINTHQLHIQVVTPASEGGTLLRGKTMHLPGLRFKNYGTPVGVFLGALDGRPLAKSSHLILLITSDAVNSGIQFTNHRRILEGIGHAPILARIVHLRITLRHVEPAGLKLWALAYDGARVARLPLKVLGSHLTAMINTGDLPGGPTPFFELGYK